MSRPEFELNKKNSVPPKEVAIIGAGIIGISCAFFLQRDGHKITIYDPKEAGAAASFGNSGAINESSIMPSSTPGLVGRIPKMLADPESPLVVRWPYLLRLFPWLVGFLKNSQLQKVERNCRATASLTKNAIKAYDILQKEINLEDLIHRRGALKVYETDTSFKTSLFERQLLDNLGCAYEILNQDKLRQLEPNLAPIFKHALFLENSRGILNPARLVTAITTEVIKRGGKFRREKVQSVEFLDTGQPRVLTERGSYDEDLVVLAAGAWSGPLAKKLGARVTLDTERGYHIKMQHPSKTISRYVQFADKRFALVPQEDSLQITSIVELASVKAKPDFRRIRRMLPHAARVLPGLNIAETSIWMGARPSTPDNVPVIGKSEIHENVFFAFGHSHLGMTMGPVTGSIISDLIANRELAIDLTAYRSVRPFWW